MTVRGGKLYALVGSGDLATVEEYDPATDSWTRRASLPTGRYDLGAATGANGRIYAIGGIAAGTRLSTVDEGTITP